MKKQFTLIELIVVIIIIALLAGTLLPMLNKARAKARLNRTANELKVDKPSIEKESTSIEPEKIYFGIVNNKNVTIFKMTDPTNERITIYSAMTDDGGISIAIK